MLEFGIFAKTCGKTLQHDILFMYSAVDPEFPRGKAPTNYLAFCAENCMKMKKSGREGGVPTAPTWIRHWYFLVSCLDSLNLETTRLLLIL